MPVLLIESGKWWLYFSFPAWVYFQSCLDMLRKLRSEKQVLSSQVGQIFLSILPCHFSFGGSFQTFHTMGPWAAILIGTGPCKVDKLPINFLLQSSCNSLHWWAVCVLPHHHQCYLILSLVPWSTWIYISDFFHFRLQGSCGRGHVFLLCLYSQKLCRTANK